MNFNRGDHVVHHTFGVGTVVSVEGMNFTGNEPRLFYRVDFERTTIWVPLNEQPSGGLRPITQKAELGKYRSILKSKPTPLEADTRKRQVELEKRWHGMAFGGLCELVRDLSALKDLQTLNNYEKKLYRQCWDALVMEWASVCGCTPVDAEGEIGGYLLQGKRLTVHD